ncbi:uncharacterized protein V6R79_025894 [Siganus canaliculatus]
MTVVTAGSHSMKLSSRLCTSPLALLFLALLCPAPRPVAPYPLSPRSVLPLLDAPDLDSTLLDLQAALELALWPRDPLLALLESREEDEEERVEEEEEEEEVLVRAQRGDLVARVLAAFPGVHALEVRNYQESREGDDGGKRNEALTSIAGGLQAVSREKGGFGFRFGRKRWSERGRKAPGRRSTEETTWK